MKKISRKLSLVLLMILSFVLMISATASIIVNADLAAADEPAVISAENDSWYDISYDDNSLTILFDAGISDYKVVSKADLLDIKNKLIAAFRTILIDKLLGTNAPAMVYADLPMTVADEENGDELPGLSENVLGKYMDFIKDRLKVRDENGVLELEKYLAGEYDTVIKYAVAQYIEEHKDEIDDAQIQRVIESVQNVVNEVIYEVIDDDAIRENYKALNNDKVQDIVQEVADVIERGESVTLSVMEILTMLRRVAINDVVVFSNGSFHTSSLKQLISQLPRPAEIANRADKDMHLDFSISIDTTVGETDFDLIIGFKGDCSKIRGAAKFIADHVEVYNQNGVYTAEVTLPEEVSALLLKLANTSRIPDNIKHAVFGLFDKTGDEIFDKVSSYEYEEILNYLKGKDFQGVFASLLDAEKIKSYFSGYNVDLSKFSDDNVDKLINKILEYAEKVANKKTVEGVEEFLRGYGISGIPEQMEAAVQKFLNLLNKIDYKSWNAKTIRTFINDKSAFNSKVNAAIARLADSATTKKLYEKFISYAERMFNKLPDQIHNGTILDLYKGDGELGWSGNIEVDVRRIFTKIVNKLVPYIEDLGFENAGEYVDSFESLFDTWFEGETSFDINLSLSLTMPDVYKVEYFVNEETVSAGLLPAGADVAFFADLEEVDGYKVIGWADEDGNFIEKMPKKDVKLFAVTEFEVAITIDEEELPLYEKTYEGEAVVLTATINGAAGLPKYEWYKGDKLLEDQTESELKLVNVSDSGIYYVVVTNTSIKDQVISAISQKVEVIIKQAEIDFTVGEWVKSEEVYVYDGEEKIVDFDLPIDFNARYPGLEWHLEEAAKTDAGEYKAYIVLDNYDSENYFVTLPEIGKDAEHGYEWGIERAEINLSEEDWGEYDFTYEKGTEYSVTFTLSEEYKDKITVTQMGELTGEEAGKYEAYIVVEYDTNNYNYIYTGKGGDEKTPYVWEIKQATVTVESIELVSATEGVDIADFIYNGTSYTVAVDYILNIAEVKLAITYTDNSDLLTQSKAGAYHAIFTIALAEGYQNNYILSEDGLEYNEPWSIAKAKLDLGGYWGYKAESGDYVPYEEDAFVYSGSEFTVEFILTVGEGQKLPAEIVLKNYKNNVKTDANEDGYTATVEIDYGNATDNYDFTIIAEDNLTLVWVILRAEFDFAAYKWDYTEAFTYDGEKHTVALIAKDGKAIVLPQGVEFAYGDTYFEINAGKYTASVGIKGDKSTNYKIVNQVEDLEWEINPATIDFSKIGEWVKTADDDYVYSAKEKSVTYTLINGYLLPKEVKFTSEGNKATNVGTYYAYLVVTVEGTNYKVENPWKENNADKDKYPWTITPFVIDFAEGGIPQLYIDGELTESVEYDGKEHVASLKYILKKATPEEGVLVCIPTDDKHEDAGNYEVTFKFSIAKEYENNYELGFETTSYPCTWKITPVTLSFEAHWEYGAEGDVFNKYENDTEIVFNGKPWTVKYVIVEESGKTYPGNLVTITYADQTNRNATVYSTTATISISDTKNYSISGLPEDNKAVLPWEIKQAEISLKGITWDYEGAFKYNGDAHTVNLNGADAILENIIKELKLEAGSLKFEYINNEKIEVGAYEASVELDGVEKDNFYISDKPGLLTWYIRGEISVINNKWNYDSANPFEYSGELYTVVIDVKKEDLPDGVDIDYEGIRSATDVGGPYKVKVILTGENSEYYDLVGESVELTWYIVTKKISVENYEWKWTADNFEYDGTEKEVLITNAEEFGYYELLLIAYDGNKGTEHNTYTAKATFTLKGEYSKNYELVGKTVVEHKWTITKTQGGGEDDYNEWTHNVAGIDVKLGGNVPEDVLKNAIVAESTKRAYTDEMFDPWVKSNTHAQIIKVYSISMALPEGFTGYITITVTYNAFEGKDLLTVHIADDVTDVNKDNCGDSLETIVIGNTVSFKTNSFSDFVIVQQVPEKAANYWWVWLLVAIIIILIIILIILIIIILRKNDEPEEEPVVVTEDVAEPMPEEVKEEITEEVVETTESELESESEPEPEPIEELPDETAVVVAPIEEPAPEPIVTPVVVESGKRTVYDRSFIARLSQADDTIKAYYSELKNEILAYKGVKSRISWHFDSFNRGRDKCIKLQLRGKSLYMYIALNPADIEEKYRATDVSDKARYIDVPAMVRIRKPRSLKYAKQLVAVLMEKMDVQRGATHKKQYKVNYKSTEALLQAGLIKIKVTKGNFKIAKSQDNSDKE